MSRFISPQESKEFMDNGLEQLDLLLVGEQEAKIGMLVTMAAGLNIVLAGEPGGGKTTLGRDSYRIIEDIEEDGVANIPPQSDLTATQLVGGEVLSTKGVHQPDGEDVYETTRTEIAGIVQPDAQVLFANEINRINPHALNVLLEVLESRRLENTAGVQFMGDLEYAVATMNPGEANKNVFNIAHAHASRIAIGAAMGENDQDSLQILHKIGQNWAPAPDEVKAVTTLDGLHAIRDRIYNGTSMPSNLWEGIAIPRIMEVRQKLAAIGMKENVGRLGHRIKVVAQAHAALHGQETVDKRDFDMAVRSMVVARLGVLGTRETRTGQMTITDAANELLSR